MLQAGTEDFPLCTLYKCLHSSDQQEAKSSNLEKEGESADAALSDSTEHFFPHPDFGSTTEKNEQVKRGRGPSVFRKNAPQGKKKTKFHLIPVTLRRFENFYCRFTGFLSNNKFQHSGAKASDKRKKYPRNICNGEFRRRISVYRCKTKKKVLRILVSKNPTLCKVSRRRKLKRVRSIKTTLKPFAQKYVSCGRHLPCKGVHWYYSSLRVTTAAMLAAQSHSEYLATLINLKSNKHSEPFD